MSRLDPLPGLGGLRRTLSRRRPERTYPVVEDLRGDLDAEGVQVTSVIRQTGELDELDEPGAIDEIDDFDELHPHRAEVLEVRDVTLRFGGLVALDQISLSVYEGEIVGLIGPNGAGKTTLFECVSGFYHPDRGHVYYQVPETAEGAQPGQVLDLLQEPPHRRAWLGIGRTFQNCRMFQNLSVFDALRIAQHRWMTTGPVSAGLGTKRSAVDEERVAEATNDLCQMMGLRPYQNRFCAELSYGTLRLVELAAIMALRPKFLLLDEPSSGISQKETEQLLPLLQDVRTVTGSTILIIEHDMPLIMGLSDRIYAMAAGAVISSGTPDEVQADPRVIESYLGTSRYGTVVGSNA